MMVPCSGAQGPLVDHLNREAAHQKSEIDRLKKKVNKMKAANTEKDKTIGRQKNVYREMKTLRDKHRDSEKERLA